MKRTEFLKKFGIGLVAIVAAPKIIAKAVEDSTKPVVPNKAKEYHIKKTKEYYIETWKKHGCYPYNYSVSTDYIGNEGKFIDYFPFLCSKTIYKING